MGPLRSVSLLTICGPLWAVSLLITIWGSPQVRFFAYRGAPSSDQFLCLPCGAPLDKFLRILYGCPLRSVSSHTIWGPPQIRFFAYYMEAPSDMFLRILYGAPLRLVFSLTKWGPLRSVSSLTIWGPLIFF